MTNREALKRLRERPEAPEMLATLRAKMNARYPTGWESVGLRVSRKDGTVVELVLLANGEVKTAD